MNCPEKISEITKKVTKSVLNSPWGRGILAGGLGLSTIPFTPLENQTQAQSKEIGADSVTLIDGSGSIDNINYLLMDWNGATPEQITRLAKALKTIPPFDKVPINVYFKHPTRDLRCGKDNSDCDFEAVNKETDEVTTSGLPIDFTMVGVRSYIHYNYPTGGGGQSILPSCSEPPTNHSPAAVFIPQELFDDAWIPFASTVAHERGHQNCLRHEGGDLMDIGGPTKNFNAEHTQFLIANSKLMPFSIRRNSLAIKSTPSAIQSADQTISLNKMEVPVSVEIPGGTTYLKLWLQQEDGADIKLILSDKAVLERIRAGEFKIEAQSGIGKWVLQPDQKVTEIVSVSNEDKEPDWDSPAWVSYEARPGLMAPASSAQRTYRLPSTDSKLITALSPQSGENVNSINPKVQWYDGDTNIFYFEIQLSKDSSFNTDRDTAIAPVYWNLVHGGLSTPPNSWTVPEGADLDPGTQYYWRVRARIQGSGTPVEWSQTFNFNTPTPPGLKSVYGVEADKDYGNGIIGPSKADYDRANPPG